MRSCCEWQPYYHTLLCLTITPRCLHTHHPLPPFNLLTNTLLCSLSNTHTTVCQTLLSSLLGYYIVKLISIETGFNLNCNVLQRFNLIKLKLVQFNSFSLARSSGHLCRNTQYSRNCLFVAWWSESLFGFSWLVWYCVWLIKKKERKWEGLLVSFKSTWFC